MNHTNSNLNLSKKNKQMKSNNKNNFNKSSKNKKNNEISKIYFNKNNINNFYHIYTNNNCYNSIDFTTTKTNSNKANNLNLPYKDIVKSSTTYNKKDNKIKNKQFTLKISNSNKFMSFNGLSSKNMFNKSSPKNSHNIRLNLNNDIIYNNLRMENNRRINKRKNKDIFYTEQIKEKNNIINKLQKDLMLSEMILNELINKDDKSDMFYDKNFESIRYDISNNNINNNKTLTLNFNMGNVYHKKMRSLTNIRPLLTFNYINNNNITYNNTYKKSISPENKTIHKNHYFYSLSNKNNFDCNKGSLSSKNKNNIKIIFVKKSGPFCERNFNEDKNDKNRTTNDKNENEFKNFVKKCENLKKRSKEILNKYIKLGESFNNNLLSKKKVEFG